MNRPGWLPAGDRGTKGGLRRKGSMSPQRHRGCSEVTALRSDLSAAFWDVSGSLTVEQEAWVLVKSQL